MDTRLELQILMMVAELEGNLEAAETYQQMIDELDERN